MSNRNYMTPEEQQMMGQQVTSSYMTPSSQFGYNPFTGQPILPGRGDAWPHRPWSNPKPLSPMTPPDPIEQRVFIKGITRQRTAINPINQLDLLFAHIYDKFVIINDDADLVKYWSFDTEYLLNLFAGKDFDHGQYAEGGVYVYRNINREAIMTTPYLQFIVSESGLKIEGVSVRGGVADDNIVHGLIPILRFIRSITENEVKVFDPNYDVFEDFDDEISTPKKKQPKKGK